MVKRIVQEKKRWWKRPIGLVLIPVFSGLILELIHMGITRHQDKPTPSNTVEQYGHGNSAVGGNIEIHGDGNVIQDGSGNADVQGTDKTLPPIETKTPPTKTQAVQIVKKLASKYRLHHPGNTPEEEDWINAQLRQGGYPFEVHREKRPTPNSAANFNDPCSMGRMQLDGFTTVNTEAAFLIEGEAPCLTAKRVTVIGGKYGVLTKETSSTQAPINSMIENAGKLEGADISGGEVTAPTGGSATVLHNLRGGEASNIKIENSRVSSASAMAQNPAPIGISNSRDVHLNDNVLCNSSAGLRTYDIANFSSRGDTVNNLSACNWGNFVLGPVLRHREDIGIFMDKWKYQMERFWAETNIPIEKKEQYRKELSEIKGQLVDASSDEHTFRTVTTDLVSRPPSFEVKQPY
jgi:hypothetical protein